MTNAPPIEGAARGADDGDLLVKNAPAFRIKNLRAVSYGSKVYEFAAELDGVGVLNLDIFEPDGRSRFVAPRSIRSKFSGSYERTFRLDAALAVEILAAVEALVADDEVRDDGRR